jgi:hypothetical protein
MQNQDGQVGDEKLQHMRDWTGFEPAQPRTLLLMLRAQLQLRSGAQGW